MNPSEEGENTIAIGVTGFIRHWNERRENMIESLEQMKGKHERMLRKYERMNEVWERMTGFSVVVLASLDTVDSQKSGLPLEMLWLR